MFRGLLELYCSLLIFVLWMKWKWIKLEKRMFLLFYFWIGIKKDCYFNLFMNCLYGIPSLPWIHFKILSYFSLSQVIVSVTFGRFFDKIHISVKKSAIEIDERKDILNIINSVLLFSLGGGKIQKKEEISCRHWPV